MYSEETVIPVYRGYSETHRGNIYIEDTVMHVYRGHSETCI